MRNPGWLGVFAVLACWATAALSEERVVVLDAGEYASADAARSAWRLIEKGWLDFVCPMQYTEDAAMFEAHTRQSQQWVAGRIPLVPGIGATLGQSPDGTLQQVLTTRTQKCAGFVLFNYDRQLPATLELLRLGATGEKAKAGP